MSFLLEHGPVLLACFALALNLAFDIVVIVQRRALHRENGQILVDIQLYAMFDWIGLAVMIERRFAEEYGARWKRRAFN